MSSNPSDVPFIHQIGSVRNLLIETPHLGRSIPVELQSHGKLVTSAKKRWDNCVDLAGSYLLEKVGGEWIGSIFSRMVCDLNRGADRVDSRVCPQWPGARTYEDGGVIKPYILEGKKHTSLYSTPLQADEIEHRLEKYWFPYHDRLQERLDAILERFGHAILISLHSAEPEPEQIILKQPVIYLGSCNGATCDAGILNSLQSTLENKNLLVISEGVYQGAFTTQAYGKDPRIHAIQIELDRRYMKTKKDLFKQLEPLAIALQGVSTAGLQVSSSSKRSQRYSGIRTFIDPLSGEIQIY